MLKNSAVFLMVFFSCAALRADVVDKIAVVVNDEVVTLSEIDAAAAPLSEKYKTIYSGEELDKKLSFARHDAVEQLIDQKVLLGAAKRENVEVSEKEIDARVEDVAKNFSSRSDFEKAIQGQGMTMTKLRARYKDQIMVRRLIEKKVISRISVSPVEVDNYYKEHSDRFAAPEEISLRNILIRMKDDPSDTQKRAELAQDILKRLKSGEDFAALAKEYSEGPGAEEGGSMGFVRRGDLMKQIEDAVFNLEPGGVSEIIQTSLGYHMFKVEERVKARTPELAEVKRKVEDTIFREKIDKGAKEFVKDLRKHAYIAFK